MATPVFDKYEAQPSQYVFPSKTDSNITKVVFRIGRNDLEIHFASKEEVLAFCKKNGLTADFSWLNFSTFEGEDLPKIQNVLGSYFVCDKTKAQFENLTRQLMT